MQKSKDITKYEPKWQILRARLRTFKTVEEKLNTALLFFEHNQNKDNWERVTNWMEGLAMGYKAAKDFEAIDKIFKAIDYMNTRKDDVADCKEESFLFEFSEFEFSDKKRLYMDLFKRGQKWCSGGFNHKEHYVFMEALWNSFSSDEKLKIKTSYLWSNYVSLAITADNSITTHKFFF